MYDDSPMKCKMEALARRYLGGDCTIFSDILLMVRRCARCSKNVVTRKATDLQGPSQQKVERGVRERDIVATLVIIEHRTGGSGAGGRYRQVVGKGGSSPGSGKHSTRPVTGGRGHFRNNGGQSISYAELLPHQNIECCALCRLP